MNNDEFTAWLPDTDGAHLPSLGAIAAEAGVSRSTVSRVMRNDSRISLATKKRVRLAANRLGYRPNPLLSALMERVRTGRDISYQGTIAMVTEAQVASEWFTPGATSWASMHAGAVARARECGYKVEYFSTCEFGKDGRRLSRILEARDIHGVYITPGFRERRACLDWGRVSAATTGHGLHDPMLHRVCYHGYHGIQIACAQLRSLGYRRIALYLGKRNNEVTDNNYLAGFLLFLESVAPEDRIRPVLVPRYTPEDFRDWFRAHSPDAVIGNRSEILEWAGGLGARCPDDFGFVHLDHSPDRDFCAGINHNSGLVGRGVIDLIIAQIHRGETGVPAHPTTTLVEGYWVSGPSVRRMGKPAEATIA
jgi:DNA-binding LacI/PurR family transcriptional regulator